jgi:hypothetical protein
MTLVGLIARVRDESLLAGIRIQFNSHVKLGPKTEKNGLD